MLMQLNTKAFRCSAIFQKTQVFCAQRAQDKNYRNNRMDWHSNSTPLPKELIQMEGKEFSETSRERIVLN